MLELLHIWYWEPSLVSTCTYETSSMWVKYLSQDLRSKVLVGTSVGTFVWLAAVKFASFDTKTQLQSPP